MSHSTAACRGGPGPPAPGRHRHAVTGRVTFDRCLPRRPRPAGAGPPPSRGDRRAWSRPSLLVSASTTTVTARIRTVTELLRERTPGARNAGPYDASGPSAFDALHGLSVPLPEGTGHKLLVCQMATQSDEDSEPRPRIMRRPGMFKAACRSGLRKWPRLAADIPHEKVRDVQGKSEPRGHLHV